jgi:hypothetical protein
MYWHQLGIKVGENFLWAQGTEGTSDTLLAWHIATTIFEARNPPSPSFIFFLFPFVCIQQELNPQIYQL